MMLKQQTVDVVFVDSKDIPCHIRRLKTGKKTNKQKLVLSNRFKSELKSQNAKTQQDIPTHQPIEDDSNLNIYSFKSCKRTGQLYNKTVESLKQQNTPTTLSRLRKKRSNPLDDLEDDFSDNTESEEEVAEVETPISTQKEKAIMPVSSSSNQSYFRAQGDKKNCTSNNTLKKLKGKRLDINQISEALNKAPKNSISKKIDAAKKVLENKNKLMFKEWEIYLTESTETTESYNILLFGFGSKRNLIHSFCNSKLLDEDKLVVNGFFPGLTIKSILNSICSEVLREESPPVDIVGMSKLICDHYKKSLRALYLIIHNIDGVALRLQNSQQILSQLASNKNIHLIASVDHINSPLIWEQKTILSFNWLSFDSTTYERYKEETSNEGSLALAGRLTSSSSTAGGLVLSALLHVTGSLTRNARACFRILVKDHLEEHDQEQKGTLFPDLYRRARESFFVNSEVNLRAHLTEFIDHKLLQIRKSGDGGEVIVLTVDRNILQDYLEQDDEKV